MSEKNVAEQHDKLVEKLNRTHTNRADLKRKIKRLRKNMTYDELNERGLVFAPGYD